MEMEEVTGIPESDDYLLLKDLKLRIEGDGAFCFCFWLYLVNPTPAPAAIIRQVHSDATNSIPFLIISENTKFKLLPVLFTYKEDAGPNSLASWMNSPCASADFSFPLKRWVHVGCEVSNNLARLHIDGEIVGEEHLISSLNNVSSSNDLRAVTLTGIDGDGVMDGYLHNAEVLPMTSSIRVHRFKDPPVQLSVDSSSVSGIEVGTDGIWSIVDNQASHHRIFSLDVILSDAFGQPSDRELEVVASLLFDDDRESVEAANDSEAPLLAIHDGIEFASWYRPSALLHGRASFKLKISQLPSICDNKLLRIRFDVPKFKRYPFFEVISLPICRVTWNRTLHPLYVTCEKSSCNVERENGYQSSDLDDISAEYKENDGYDSKSCSSLKRVKLGANDEECDSHFGTINQGDNAFGSNSDLVPYDINTARMSPSDSESAEGRSLTFKCMPISRNPISDLTVFKYCLGSSTDRSLLLHEIAASASDQDLMDFAQRVSLYSGCSHHWHQIIITKRLIQEGTRVWNLISRNKHHVHWDHVVFEIEDQFMKIACCSTRTLTHQDFELLKNVAGCRESLSLENFNNLWHWMYPVAHTISRDRINALWGSSLPRWIEGFVTKEEAESLLKDPRSPQEPGTFVLRFPTSRSWPHPDAGSLIVTYIGRDYMFRHRLLSLDSVYRGGNAKPLQDLLLAEPELSRLGRLRKSP